MLRCVASSRVRPITQRLSSSDIAGSRAVGVPREHRQWFGQVTERSYPPIIAPGPSGTSRRARTYGCPMPRHDRIHRRPMLGWSVHSNGGTPRSLSGSVILRRSFVLKCLAEHDACHDSTINIHSHIFTVTPFTIPSRCLGRNIHLIPSHTAQDLLSLHPGIGDGLPAAPCGRYTSSRPTSVPARPRPLCQTRNPYPRAQNRNQNPRSPPPPSVLA